VTQKKEEGGGGYSIKMTGLSGCRISRQFFAKTTTSATTLRFRLNFERYSVSIWAQGSCEEKCLCFYFIMENVSTISNRRRAVVAAVFESLSICLRPGRRRRKSFVGSIFFEAIVGVSWWLFLT